MEIAHSGKDGERNFTLQSDRNGDFSKTVPLDEGINVVEIVSHHGASAQQIRQFLQLTYDPTPLALFLTVTEPQDGSTVAYAMQTVVGETLPDALVILNDIILTPDETGRWEATIRLHEGPNEIWITATLESQTANATINIEYAPDQG